MKKILIVLLFFFGSPAGFSAPPVGNYGPGSGVGGGHGPSASDIQRIRINALIKKLDQLLDSNAQNQKNLKRAMSLAKSLSKNLKHCEVNKDEPHRDPPSDDHVGGQSSGQR